MSKRSGRKNGRRGEASAETGGAGESGQHEQSAGQETSRTKLTPAERLVAKASAAYETAADVLELAIKGEVPPEILLAMQNFMVEADSWRGVVRTLVEAGWQPTPKGEMKDLKVGDKIAVADAARGLYTFVPSDVKLVVGKITRSENGRIKSVLLREDVSPDDGSARVFGWAQLSHLARRLAA